jgi:glycosyltransferase involved in cell wall biosynthesis
LDDELHHADVIVTQGYLYRLAPLLLTQKPLVIDLYDPLPIELLEHHAHLPLVEAQLSQSYCVERTKVLLRRGDFFLYSNERQRKYWLGMLTAVGRVNHRNYRENQDFSRLFGCVPYGIPDEPPHSTRTVLRGPETTFPQMNLSGKPAFSATDTIVLWGGGLWKWFDPCAVIRAIGEIARNRTDIKLVFLATTRSNLDTTRLNIAYATEEAIALSRDLGLYNRQVFFNPTWVPYMERQNYLLEADIGISTHLATLETEFSFRTRILDYLWAELPIIATRGDFLSDLIEQRNLGLVVEPLAVGQIRDALLRLADDLQFREQCRANIRQFRTQLLWSRVIAPLEEFCAAPYQTSHASQLVRWLQLSAFYLNTGKILFKYRGYKKLFAKIRTYFC